MVDGCQQPHILKPFDKEDRQRHVIHLHRMEVQISSTKACSKVINIREVAIHRRGQ